MSISSISVSLGWKLPGVGPRCRGDFNELFRELNAEARNSRSKLEGSSPKPENATPKTR